MLGTSAHAPSLALVPNRGWAIQSWGDFGFTAWSRGPVRVLPVPVFYDALVKH